jgi:zinc/manganese transport system substrate-binding protein
MIRSPTIALCRRALLAFPALLALPARAQPKSVVIATFSILGDLVAQIAGDTVELRVLIGPDQEAHDFQPRPSDAEKLRGAALVVRNGLGLDPWIERLMRGARTVAPIVTTTERLNPLLFNGIADPHAWMDVQRARTYTLNIASGLYPILPSGAEREARAGISSLMAKLARLDDDIRKELATIPDKRRVLVAPHAALRYFSDAYGVNVVTPATGTAETTPSPLDIATLVRRIKEEKITALFRSPIGNDTLIRAVALEAGVPVKGTIYTDALSPPDGPAGTYESMMRHNVRLMISAMTET